jgi:hypothetical protein
MHVYITQALNAASVVQSRPSSSLDVGPKESSAIFMQSSVVLGAAVVPGETRYAPAGEMVKRCQRRCVGFIIEVIKRRINDFCLADGP